MARVRARRTAVIALFFLVAGLLSAGVASAVSGGDYQPSEQDCTIWAESNTGRMEPGCHNFKLNVENRDGTRYAQAGIAQEAVGENPHAGDASITPNGTKDETLGTGPAVGVTFDTHYQPLAQGDCGIFDLVVFPFEFLFSVIDGNPQQPCTLDPPAPPSEAPTVTPTVQAGTPNGAIASLAQDARVYLGADDNLDSGEHDGVDGLNGTANSANGPSDGGAITVNWHPAEVAEWLATLAANPGDPTPFLTNPVPLADAGFGSCADNICLGAYSRQTTVYEGCSTPAPTKKKAKKKDPDPCANAAEQRNVYDYSGKKWDPENCSSGNAQDELNCHEDGGPQTMDEYRQAEAKRVVAEPGVQIYGDPDPQSSPIGPYPLPAAYAGTCGVTVGGGQMDLSGTPVSNSAGQASVSTGC